MSEWKRRKGTRTEVFEVIRLWWALSRRNHVYCEVVSCRQLAVETEAVPVELLLNDLAPTAALQSCCQVDGHCKLSPWSVNGQSMVSQCTYVDV